MTAVPTRQRDRMYNAAGTEPWHSGTDGFTGYMREALDLLCADGVRRTVLDLPAGHGQFTDALRRAGHTVTPADINLARPDYVRADMTARLPFADNTFDAAACLEGIEHIADPLLLLGELIRVVRPGGRVVVSTPNVMNYYSRLRFLFTGAFYQFNPTEIRDLPPGAAEDRFHISPITLHWLRYFAVYHGARIAEIRGDRAKKKWLLPLFALVHALGRPWSRAVYFTRLAQPWDPRNREMYTLINSRPMLFSRTMIVMLEKNAAGSPAALGNP